MNRRFSLAASIIATITIMAPAMVSALSPSQAGVFNNGILYFNTDIAQSATACGQSSSQDGGAAGGNSSLVWPFSTKDSSQYRRIDQGWDLQSNPGAAVYAISPGTIHKYLANPGGFGNDYPTEQLDNSIGGPTNWVYYGHVHVLPKVVNKHVNAGDQIAVANTTDPQDGSAAPPGWLEIGFARPGTDAPLDVPTNYEAWTQAGQEMHDILKNANPISGTNPTDNSCDSLNPPDPGTVSGDIALGKQMAAARGWTGQQWSCLYTLWKHESGWSSTAKNPGSGAYGIPQALGHGDSTTSYPGGHWPYPDDVKSANPPPQGSSDAGTQIQWGLGYIHGAYQTPCNAWSLWLSRDPHWY
ncbi:MAG TPA: hypothetical protein VFH37_03335 [Candidatus Saccharimonadales bacterium]|nr:hypothetical protein [Candidatus Saccharimonadales bacterium]